MKKEESQKKPTEVSRLLPQPTFPPEMEAKIDAYSKAIGPALLDNLNRNALKGTMTS